MGLFGTTLILIAQAIVSIAIIVYFRREHPDDHHWFETLVAPLIAFFAQVAVIWLMLTNLDLLGGGYAFAKWVPYMSAATMLVGLGVAFYVKKYDPEKYARMGRMAYEGVD